MTGLGDFIKAFVKRSWIIIAAFQFINKNFYKTWCNSKVNKIHHLSSAQLKIFGNLTTWKHTSSRLMTPPIAKADMSDKTHVSAQNDSTNSKGRHVW